MKSLHLHHHTYSAGILQRRAIHSSSAFLTRIPSSPSAPKAKSRQDIFHRLVASNPRLHRSLLRQPMSGTDTEPSSKRIKMAETSSPVPIIGTHNGHFHADEALAVYLLRLLPEYKTATLIRTRDPEVLKTCTIVVDVGGVHEHGAFRYDHHQREFNATFPGKVSLPPHTTSVDSPATTCLLYMKL